MLKMSASELTLKTKAKERASDKQINCKVGLCLSSGQTCNLSNCSEQTWETFRKAAAIINDLVHILLKYYCSGSPRGEYHRQCYHTYTNKRNMKYKLKR